MQYFSEMEQDWQRSPTTMCKQLPTACHARTKTYVSRKSKDVAFPAFGKCESIKLFPISFASCLNSGDLCSLAQLMNSRVDRHCDINILGHSLQRDQFYRYYELCNERFPDCVSHIHKIVVVGNQIKAVIFFKYTASKLIDKSVTVSSIDRTLPKSLHTDPARLNAFIASQPIEDRPALLTTVYTADELVVSGNGLMTLTVNERTKKITTLEITCDATGFEPVEMPAAPVPDVTV